LHDFVTAVLPTFMTCHASSYLLRTVKDFGYFVSRPTAILETTGHLQLLSLQLSADISLTKWLLHALLEPSHVSYLSVFNAAGILVHKDICRTSCLQHFTKSFGIVIGVATHCGDFAFTPTLLSSRILCDSSIWLPILIKWVWQVNQLTASYWLTNNWFSQVHCSMQPHSWECSGTQWWY